MPLPSLALLLAAAPVPGPAQPPRPLVLVVHGRGQTTRDSAALRRDALRALRAGARAVAGDSLLADDDVRVVWYADLLEPRVATSACATTPGASSPLAAIAQFAGALLDVAATGAESSQDSTGAAGIRGLVGDLHFLGDPLTRCAAEARVGASLARARSEGRPVVLVAHSLGGLVAWGHLRHRDSTAAPAVARFVTVGSPVGSPDVRRLVFGGDDGPLALPGGVRSWVNVVDAGDPFAARLLATDAPPGALVDAPTAAPHDDDPHGIVGYLGDAATVRAVLGAWCAAAGRATGACASLR